MTNARKGQKIPQPRLYIYPSERYDLIKRCRSAPNLDQKIARERERAIESYPSRNRRQETIPPVSFTPFSRSRETADENGRTRESERERGEAGGGLRRAYIYHQSVGFLNRVGPANDRPHRKLVSEVRG